MRHLNFGIGGLLLVIAGCQSGPPVPTSIMTDPPGATVYADGKAIGNTPLRHPFDFTSTPTHDIRTDLKGYAEYDKQITENTDLNVTLQPDDAYNGTVAVGANDATPGPLRIEINRDLTKKDDAGKVPWWVELNNFVSIRYGGLTQSNNDTGGLESKPAVQEFNNPYHGKAIVRTQFIGSISTLDPLVYNISIKSEISYKDAPGKWMPYDRVFKEDRDLLARIRQSIEIPH